MSTPIPGSTTDPETTGTLTLPEQPATETASTADELDQARDDLEALTADLEKLQALQAEHRSAAEAAKARYRADRKNKDLDEAVTREGQGNAVASLVTTTQEDVAAVRARVAELEAAKHAAALVARASDLSGSLKETRANYTEGLLELREELARRVEGLDSLRLTWLEQREAWKGLADELGRTPAAQAAYGTGPNWLAASLYLDQQGVNTAAFNMHPFEDPNDRRATIYQPPFPIAPEYYAPLVEQLGPLTLGALAVPLMVRAREEERAHQERRARAQAERDAQAAANRARLEAERAAQQEAERQAELEAYEAGRGGR